MKRVVVGIILFASIALNVTLLGALEARQREGKFEKRPPMQLLMKQLETLPESDRADVRETLKAKRKDMRAAMEGIKTERQNVYEYISSDQYTHEEAAKKLTALRERTTALQQLSQEMILDIADKMTPEQRKNLLAQLKDKLKF